jgi:excisionase family DNA binding protein
MAQKYYNVKEAAQLIGLTEEQVRKMQEDRTLYGYRDGADWKFKAEDIERIAAERQSAPSTPNVQDSSEDVLLSEVELGQSSAGASGTVIGMESKGKNAVDSDLSLATDSEIHLASDIHSAPAVGKIESPSAAFEELDLTLEEDATLEDSGLNLDIEKKPAESPTGTGSSVVTNRSLDDDDMVLGSGSSGSGLALGGDSGISLVDPHDSGLSLEEPLDIAGSKAESLELGEDEIVSLGGSSKKGMGSDIKTDDDFLLTPMEDAGNADESESGSQVIALDTDSDDASTMITSSPVQSVAMLEEDVAAQPVLDFSAGSPLGHSPLAATPLGVSAASLSDAAAMPASAYVPEAPYTPLQITGLVACAFFLMLCGMMMYDMIRNIWSWDSAYSANSTLMDWIISLF